MQFEHLGPYKIGKRLGRGGMGTVYEAVNTQTGESAAIKVLNPALADEEGFRDRFAVEIETLKKLRHPQVVRLYGFGEHQGILYYAMELVSGSNLEDELQNGRRFTWRETTQAGIKLSRALKLAHDHGIIHRDLKPANILLTPDGDIKLTDFGIARLFGGMNLTSDGGLIGTAEYMSPEQAEGKPVTYQSDLYSLGGVLFAMLAGRPPFRAKSLPEVLQMQRFAEAPRATQYAQDVPAALADIIARLLSKAPAARAANAGLLARELAAMEHGLLARSQRENESPAIGFSISHSETLPGDPQGEIDSQQPTRLADAATELPPKRPVSPTDATAILDEKTIGRPAQGYGTFVEGVAQPAPAALINRFTTVEEEEQRRRQHALATDRRNFFLQSLALGGALLLLLGMIGWIMRPLSADQLFERISLAAHSDNSGDLLEQESLLTQFLQRFPDDPRLAQVKKWQEELDLFRAEKRFLIRSRRMAREEQLSPLIRDYLLILQTMNTQPEFALAELRAIRQLYGTLPQPTAEERQCLELINRQITTLQEEERTIIAEYVIMLQARLAAARQMSVTQPDQAAEICAGLITLYKNRPWAISFVRQAEELLDRLPPLKTGPGGPETVSPPVTLPSAETGTTTADKKNSQQ
ncbi:MAG: serine/threonine-protein kinase [Pirellulales bacterium]|nr:serine/threonine-protein kinase [Pirellulales bacterium]